MGYGPSPLPPCSSFACPCQPVGLRMQGPAHRCQLLLAGVSRELGSAGGRLPVFRVGFSNAGRDRGGLLVCPRISLCIGSCESNGALRTLVPGCHCLCGLMRMRGANTPFGVGACTSPLCSARPQHATFARSTLHTTTRHNGCRCARAKAFACPEIPYLHRSSKQHPPAPPS